MDLPCSQHKERQIRRLKRRGRKKEKEEKRDDKEGRERERQNNLPAAALPRYRRRSAAEVALQPGNCCQSRAAGVAA